MFKNQTSSCFICCESSTDMLNWQRKARFCFRTLYKETDSKIGEITDPDPASQTHTMCVLFCVCVSYVRMQLRLEEETQYHENELTDQLSQLIHQMY